MGTLGNYLREAREALGIDLRDAAQQTRISINYLKALEEEDFSRLPGEVFVKGFLKNYGKFLRLDESEVMNKYDELRPQRSVPNAAPDKEPATPVSEPKVAQKTPIEPFIWGAGIVVVLVIFFFTAMPERHGRDAHHAETPSPEGRMEPAPVPAPKPEKLYLEIVALENTWFLVRTDNSPQKKAVLKKGESLIWSADERFLISYGSADAIKLLLNGQELTVNEPKNAVVRDLAITAAGIVNRKIQPENEKPVRPKRPAAQQQAHPSGKPAAEAQQAPLAAPQEKQAPSAAPALPLPLPWQTQ